jgi:tRNA (guanine-N7-)-methyltransferase
MGAATLAIAQANPDLGILAVDVHTPGIGALLAGVADAGLDNVRVCIGDAQDVMDQLGTASLRAIHVFFPDPWPKTRHHKRRLVRPDFVARAARLLEPGGRLHLATDIADYAEQMLAACQREPLLVNTAATADGFLPAPTDRPVTKYELRARDAGRTCRDLVFIRQGGAS